MRPRGRITVACGLLFLLALFVRGLYLADGIALLHTPEQDGSRMARRYDDTAMAILRGDGILFPQVWDPARIQKPPSGGF